LTTCSEGVAPEREGDDSQGGCSWYDIIDEDVNVTQGDIILNCPVIFPPSEISNNPDEIIASPQEYHDVIVMTQACDIEQGKVESVVVCPIVNLDIILAEYSFNNRKEKINFKNKIRKGFVLHYYLLNECELENDKFEYSVVNLGDIHIVSLELINRIVKEQTHRIRLKPLYREELSQTFAKTFMRIGLPRTIPEFKK